LRDPEHLRLVALYLVQTDLVNLLRGQIGGRLAADQIAVIPGSVGQSGDAGLLPAGGNVADLKEARKAQVGRQYLLADSV